MTHPVTEEKRNKEVQERRELQSFTMLTERAASDAASSLGKWLRSPVSLNMGDLELIPFGDLVQRVDPDGDSVSVGIGVAIAKGAQGYLLMLFSEQSARELVDILLKKPLGTTQELQGIAQSALLETANIIASAYLSAFGRHFQSEFMPGPPFYMHDLTTSILESTLQEQAQCQDRALYCDIRFSQAERHMEWHLFFLPIHDAFKSLLAQPKGEILP